ncbi:MAG: hypothetical protein A3B30_02775 [Candidatus Komeilibacteria bacterium RIFCSPLOWO2_01_FULL_52_15]|uniref:HhH-GPD domain-containing protein n=2 Tax=Candidatus Komeiliibacteriota TaxID=1817908 RepID=A0A1G2BQN3_9BACT|nr:MAG: hypothetical protein A2677_02100 [Candidatus Komeilibacteria bacterium RIFCSPHIGHO2_01_FULL_52_14]OGY90660.1 MAG: hypothetical protein A3B30_02775 [Candidatus Komeilibacteria bacterium RIFCSPLOWO2_01_FULL_52_15]
MPSADSQKFRREVYHHFKDKGRDLPWRPPSLKLRKDKSVDAYKILVAEVMLQQTQVDRVIPKYREFLEEFPTARALATSPLSKVLKVWSGLGYNRRALALKRCAEKLMNTFGGQVPHTVEELDALPGIGYHTACAIMAFAYNEPVVFVETNIRSVYLHHFFPKRKKVTDKELLPFIEATLDRSHPRRWYSALMDYGSSLKKTVENPSRRSAHHAVQSRFKGSNRELRGNIIRSMIKHRRMNLARLVRESSSDAVRVKKIATGLIREGFLRRKGDALSLVS